MDRSESEKSEMSIQEILGIVKEYAWEVLKYSWIIIIIAGLLGAYMYKRKMSSPTTYAADLSFVFNQVVTENQQSIDRLFGGIIGGSEAEAKPSFSKLQEIIKTRKIILKMLFHKAILKHDEQPKEDFLVNHYLRLFYYPQPSSEADFYFKTDSIDPYDRNSNYLLKYVYNAIVRSHLIVDESLQDIMYLKTISTSEDFSYELMIALYEELNLFYNELALEKKRRFYEMAQERTAELRGKLANAEEVYIKFVNTNGAEAGGRNNILVMTQYKATDLKKATESYFLALASMEGAWVAYEGQKQTPSMTIIDEPLYPLTVDKPSPFLHLILGLIAGGGLGFILIVARKFVRDFLRKQPTEKVSKEEEELVDIV